ncbi:hypothetical protein Cgig2_026785 [Carnegiea gigantea]|uniref:Uncharacterized protein n=1 Tax=Carnegiea gigantea TaxID=171969 RepID=A0A9Q1GLE4_9CARY|nr:hypothetical protein Cgig2_026785 [Carnegiea gigantea]
MADEDSNSYSSRKQHGPQATLGCVGYSDKPDDTWWLGVKNNEGSELGFYGKNRMAHDPQARCAMGLSNFELESPRNYRNPSNLWKGVWENRVLLQQSLRYAVGDGQRTQLWSHKWATSKPLMEMKTQPAPIIDQMRKVVDYWQADMGWRWSDLVPLLPQEALNRIAAIHLYLSLEINDQLFWGGTLSGSFTIQSAINILRGAEPPSN